MDSSNCEKEERRLGYRQRPTKFTEKCLLVILYISLIVLQTNCQTIIKEEGQRKNKDETKSDINNLDLNIVDNQCHSCHSSSKTNSTFDKNHESKNDSKPGIIDDVLSTIYVLTEEYIVKNNQTAIQDRVERILDGVLSKDRFELIQGVEIKTVDKLDRSKRRTEGRAMFDSYTHEYRLLNKIKDFVDTHVVSISLPRLMGLRSFGMKKFLLPLFIGAQVFKSILLAMFLPSILGSFGKILGKGISQLSAASSQASYPPVGMTDQDAYNANPDMNKDVMGYESDPAGAYAYPQDVNSLYGHIGDNDDNDIGNVDLSRFGMNDQKLAYIPTRNGHFNTQVPAASTNFKVFQKIPASSMILSNYDPFYSPLLSRLDGIFARLGLSPSENAIDVGQVGSQTTSELKLEACREQLVCLMYASPAKYAPYSNLVSAQLSRELNELRRPVSDNPEILRFFRYMRAARRGQEGVDCVRLHPGCSVPATKPQHTMIAAYHDINKLVTARKLARKSNILESNRMIVTKFSFKKYNE